MLIVGCNGFVLVFTLFRLKWVVSFMSICDELLQNPSGSWTIILPTVPNILRIHHSVILRMVLHYLGYKKLWDLSFRLHRGDIWTEIWKHFNQIVWITTAQTFKSFALISGFDFIFLHILYFSHFLEYKN